MAELKDLKKPEEDRRNRSSRKAAFGPGYEGTSNETSGEGRKPTNNMRSAQRQINKEAELVLEDLSDKSYEWSESDAERSSDVSGSKKYSMIKEDLENGISIRYPENQRLEVQYVSRPLDVLMRNSQLLSLKETLNGSRMVTDMYGIYLASQEENEEIVTLPLVNRCSGDVRIFVTIRASCSQHVKYFAYLRGNTGSWVKVPATMQEGVAEIEGEAFDILFLTSEPISETFILDPQGKEYICEHDNNIKMIFPQNCVEQREELTVQIIPPSNDGPVYIDEEPCIIGATKSVHVKHRKGIFRKPIQMELDLYLFDNSPIPDLTKYSFIDVHAINKQTSEIQMHELTSQNYKNNRGGFSLHMEVDDFESHNVQLGDRRKLFTATGKLYVRMVHDVFFHCHILVFITKYRQDYQGKSIRIECVEQKHVQGTIDKLNDLGFVELKKCRSEPIFIEDGERIRISLKGGMKLPGGFSKDHMVITFLREGLHKHIVFPVDIDFGNRPTNLGYIHFNCCNGRLLYVTHFDVDVSFKWKRYNTSGQSNMQISNGSGSEGATPNYTRTQPNVQTPIGSRSGSVTANDTRTPTNVQTQTGSRSGSVTAYDTRTPTNVQTQTGSRSGSVTAYGINCITVPNIILTLTNALPFIGWKFIFRAICVPDGSEIKADDIISEAEKNFPGDVREVMYQSLQNWADRKNFSTPREMLDTLIQRLETDNNHRTAAVLKEKFIALGP